MTSLDGINGPSIQTLLRGESDSKQSDEFQATGEYAGEKAGDKIIQLLSKKNKNTKTPVAALPIENPQSRELSD